MNLNNIEVLCSKVESKTNGKGEAYLLIDLLDISSGDSFNIMSKDITLMGKLKPMTKYNIDLNLSSSKYGLKLEINNIVEELVSI